MALEEARSFVGQLAPAVVRVDGEAAEVGDPVALVREVEAHRAGAAPLAVFLDLDHEAADLLRLGERALDLIAHICGFARAPDAEERLDVVVGGELSQEVDVVEGRSAEPEPVTEDDVAHGDAGTGARRGSLIRPDPSAVPVRIRTSPAIADIVTVSPSSTAP